MEFVVTDDIARECWSRLLEFANEDIAVEAIASRHGSCANKHSLGNYRKQAQQLRACLLQAREYFAAAEASSLVTSPNHAYYGMASLASSCMLLLGDGTKSLDRLRNTPSSRTHGLRFSTTSGGSEARRGVELLSRSGVEVLSKGFFSNWYSVFPKEVYTHALVSHKSRRSSLVQYSRVGVNTCDSVENLAGKRYSIFDLMQYLPDLAWDWRRYNLAPPLSGVWYEMKIELDGKKQRTHTWSIHNAGSKSNLAEILACFEVSGRNADLLTIRDEHEFSAVVTYAYGDRDEPSELKFPSSRMTLDLDFVCYSIELTRPELLDIYLCSFGLSMLSRYFPDLWLSCLESNCLAAKVIERFTEMLRKKAPMLALSYLSGKDCIFTTHKPAYD